MKNIFVFAVAAILAACGDNVPPPQAYQQPVQQYQQPVQQYQQPVQQPQYAPQPAQVVQQPQQGIGTGTAIVGAAAVGTAAYLIGKNAGEKNAAANTRVITPPPPPSVITPSTQKTIIQPAVVTKPSPAPVAPVQTFKPQAAKNSVTVTPPRTSSFSVSKRK